jgi:hypothetical protein
MTWRLRDRPGNDNTNRVLVASLVCNTMSDAAHEIENLLYAYAERIDAGDLEGVAALRL